MSDEAELLSLLGPTRADLDIEGEAFGGEVLGLAPLEDRLGDVGGEKTKTEDPSEVGGPDACFGGKIPDAITLPLQDGVTIALG